MSDLDAAPTPSDPRGTSLRGPTVPEATPVFIGPVPPPHCRDCGFVVANPAAGCGNCAAVVADRRGRPEADPVPLPGTVRTALALYFLILFTFVPLYFVPEDFAVQALMVVEVVDVLLVLAWTAVSWRSVGPSLLRFGRWWWYPAMATLGVGTFLFAHYTVGFVANLFDIETFSYSEPILDAGFGWNYIIFSIVIQPAVIEELAFRGIILGSLRSVLGVHEAVIVSALMFMVIHVSPYGLPYLLLLGLLLGYVRVKSKSIWPCVLLHGVHNGLVIASEAWWGV